MWLDPKADGCVYDTVDCFHDCPGCHWAYRSLGGRFPDPFDDAEDVDSTPDPGDNLTTCKYGSMNTIQEKCDD